MHTCGWCETESDVEAETARAEAHRKYQIHLDFVERCPESHPRLEGIRADLYDTPWLVEGRDVWFCGEECRETYMDSDTFAYLFCNGCDRHVCEQHPRNGWHRQFRNHEELGYVCLRCYEQEILENGQPRSDFEGNTIKGGMFFELGNPEPKARGFEPVPRFTDYLVGSRLNARVYNTHACILIDSGGQVLTAYERLSILGDEGTITMFARGKDGR